MSSCGRIDRDSFQRFVAAATDEFGSITCANHLFDLIDKNGDKEISQAEFKAFWYQGRENATIDAGVLPVITWMDTFGEEDLLFAMSGKHSLAKTGPASFLSA